jgi:hypothetical protein
VVAPLPARIDPQQHRVSSHSRSRQQLYSYHARYYVSIFYMPSIFGILILRVKYAFVDAVDVCIDMGIFLVALPANSTHLFQPLDVAVFRAFKGEIRDALERSLLTTDACKITKRDALNFACQAYQKNDHRLPK